VLSSFLSLPFSPGGALFGTIRGGLGIFSKNTKKDKKPLDSPSTSMYGKGMNREMYNETKTKTERELQ